MIRYADDKAVVASSEKNSQEYGMKINVKKTKAMGPTLILVETCGAPFDFAEGVWTLD